MVKAFLRIESSCSFAGSDAAVPLVGHEIGATEQVVGFGVGGRMADLLLQGSNRFIYATGREKLLGRGDCITWQ